MNGVRYVCKIDIAVKTLYVVTGQPVLPVEGFQKG